LILVEFKILKKNGPVRRSGPAAAHPPPWYDTPRLHAAHSPADETCGAAAPPGSAVARPGSTEKHREGNNFTLRVSTVLLLKHEHQHIQYPLVTIKVLMFGVC
jgi:hypothetical protein